MCLITDIELFIRRSDIHKLAMLKKNYFIIFFYWQSKLYQEEKLTLEFVEKSIEIDKLLN